MKRRGRENEENGKEKKRKDSENMESKGVREIIAKKYGSV
jgi:hypothetical protein